MKYYIIAGEASGDLHASNMMKQILLQDNAAYFRFWGGDKMKKVGGELVKHYKDLAFMGFVEVVKNLPTILRNISFCKQDIENYQPDALILVDYPGFNLRIAQWAKEKGYKVYYYISPQIWAWKQSRVHKIKRIVDKMYCILPFEKDFYKKFDYEAEFVGHPLLDAIQSDSIQDVASIREKYKFGSDKIVLLLPGSREQEIASMLKVMVQVAAKNKEYRFVIASVNSISPSFYKEQIGDVKIDMISGDTYSLLSVASAAMVTSGTATLETALFQVPEVVCYKTSWISYLIGRQLVKLKFISLVNLILNKEEVQEFSLEAANQQEIDDTVAVMGGEDWQMWMNALNDAGVLAKDALTLAYSYIGPEVTEAVYRKGTIGRAKDHLEATAFEITKQLESVNCKAYVSVNKALVTQASSAIPVIPLYISLLYKIMKEDGIHEGCIEQIQRLFEHRLYSGSEIPTDDKGRIRIDDWEMRDDVQEKVAKLWKEATTESLPKIGDLKGYTSDFHNLFGFGFDGVDYQADTNEMVNISSIS